MIFAAYAGTGKTFATENLDKVLDMVIVPYKYKFPQEYKKENFSESNKGCVEYPFEEKYPEKYVADTLKNRENYNHILIEEISICKALELYDATFV